MVNALGNKPIGDAPFITAVQMNFITPNEDWKVFCFVLFRNSIRSGMSVTQKLCWRFLWGAFDVFERKLLRTVQRHLAASHESRVMHKDIGKHMADNVGLVM